jgi:hypothetical protein
MTKVIWSTALCATIFLTLLAASASTYGDTANFGLIGWTLILASTTGATKLILRRFD